MADNEFGLTDSELAQLMNEVADCLGPDLINELMSEAVPISPLPPAPATYPQGECPLKYFLHCFKNGVIAIIKIAMILHTVDVKIDFAVVQQPSSATPRPGAIRQVGALTQRKRTASVQQGTSKRPNMGPSVPVSLLARSARPLAASTSLLATNTRTLGKPRRQQAGAGSSANQCKTLF